MIRMENHLGTIEISESYFSSLVGNAASSCFGVVGMANSNARQGILFQPPPQLPRPGSRCA